MSIVDYDLFWKLIEQKDEVRHKLLMESLASEKQIGGTYYKDMGIEPWDVVDTWPIDYQIGVYRHGALKYIMRMGTKDEEIQEIKKAIHYLEKLIEVLEKRNVSK